jgi:hypothetical protein
VRNYSDTVKEQNDLFEAAKLRQQVRRRAEEEARRARAAAGAGGGAREPFLEVAYRTPADVGIPNTPAGAPQLALEHWRSRSM